MATAVKKEMIYNKLDFSVFWRKFKIKGMKYRNIILLMVLIFVFVFLASFFFGRYPMKPIQLIGIVASKLKVIPITQFWPDNMENMLINVRLPRILMAPLVGCCLAVSGVAYQGIFQNPMASPDFLGASSGAALGAAVAIILSLNSAMITGLAFVFSIATVMVVIFISRCAPGSRVTSMILAGVIVSSLCSSGTSFLKLVADPNEQLPKITYWLMGSLSGVKLESVGWAVIPMVIGLIPLLVLRWRMNLLTLGDEEAASMGINVQRVRVIVILCATLITAASVAYSGVIGWIGLVIPHFARRIVGNNYMRLLPATMILGAVFLLVVDDVARNLLATEIPIGILTAIIGAPFFIYLITRKEERL